MSATRLVRMLAPEAVSERAWQEWVLELAELTGWTLRYHTFDSRRSAPGFPDLVLARPTTAEAIVVELKRENGRVTPAQARWLEGLERCGIEVHVWRPSQQDLVAERLKRKV